MISQISTVDFLGFASSVIHDGHTCQSAEAGGQMMTTIRISVVDGLDSTRISFLRNWFPDLWFPQDFQDFHISGFLWRILNSFECSREWRIRDTSGHHSTAPGLRLIPYVRRTPLKRNYGSNSLPPALLENRGRQWHCISFVCFSPNNLHKRTHFYPISVSRLPFFGLLPTTSWVTVTVTDAQMACRF